MQTLALFDDYGLNARFWSQAIFRPSEDGTRHPAIPPEAIPITDDQHRAIVLEPQAWRWNGVELEAFTPPVAPPAVPESVSDRRFSQALAEMEVITWAEAKAWGSRGDIPAALQAAVAAIPDELARNRAEHFLSSCTEFDRHHPMTAALAAAMGWSDTQLDELWLFASTL